MKSVISERGQTVVPVKLRKKLRLVAGTALDWLETAGGMMVVKLVPKKPALSFLEALKRFGSVPAAPRDKRPVQPAEA